MNPLQIQFSQIYDDYVEKIYRYIFLKVSTAELAEDLTSDTFMRGWKAFCAAASGDHPPIENPQAFLYQIARNLIADHYREKGKEPQVRFDEENQDTPDPQAAVEEMAADRSEMYEVKQAITALKDDYQEAVVLHYIDEVSVPEIAVILAKSEGAVRVLLHRALKALKKEIEKQRREV